MFLGIVSGICELYFYDAVRRCFGNRVGLFTFVFLLFSPGMFLASTGILKWIIWKLTISAAYLPSSFSMYALLIAFGAWFK
jgi:alpha-1,2-mannosyltransferase